MAKNFFADYTLSIIDLYEDTKAGIEQASKRPPKKVYNNAVTMLKESFFLGATRFGDNYVC